MFQCRTRLCGWCSRRDSRSATSMGRFNAARGFVGGAAKKRYGASIVLREFQCRTRLCGWCSFQINSTQSTHIQVSMPHAALWVVQRRCTRTYGDALLCFNAARGFVGGAAVLYHHPCASQQKFQCRTRLCGWCSIIAGFVVVATAWFQCRTRLCGWCSNALVDMQGALTVSMPHAALWVVQRSSLAWHTILVTFQCRTRLCGWCSTEKVDEFIRHLPSFNAARGFVGGAADIYDEGFWCEETFQCRTRLCGWCSFVARSPCPPRGKKPFWKVSENLSVLTENM